MILLIDNYDSFTYNIYQYLCQLNQSVLVKTNESIELRTISELNPTAIVISPGPGHPTAAGISVATITQFAGTIPILGICLGHQAIAAAFGGNVVRARQPMHGKTSTIYHRQKGIFNQLPCPFTVMRYHSLVVEVVSLPACLITTAWTTKNEDINIVDEIMAIKHCSLPIEGVQFHPESIMSEYGLTILQNFLVRYHIK